MNLPVVGAIIRKDLGEFSRNRFFVFITLLVLIAYGAIYWFLPDQVNENVAIGVVSENLPGDISDAGGSGLSLIAFATPEELRSAVEDGNDDISAGIVFPFEFAADIASGVRPTVTLLVPAGMPDEIGILLEGLVSEVAYAISGSPPPVDPITDAVVLGIDRAGDQVPLQQQMRPLLLVMVLMVETFALSSLVSIEVQSRTVVALLATPARIADFLAAKGIFGVALAYSEVLLLGLVIGAFSANAGPVLVILLLGAILVTGFGLVAGAFGKDFLGTILVAFAFMIPLMIPAFGALFPGTTPAWIKVLPTYGLVQGVIEATVDGAGLQQIAPVLFTLVIWCVVAMLAGAVLLKRRVAAL